MKHNLPLPFPDSVRRCKLLVVGDVMLDRYWYGTVVRISPEAPVPVVRVEEVEDRLGGAANVALNLQTLGAQATLLSVVGLDEAGKTIQALISKNGVRDEVIFVEGLQTVVKTRVVGRNQQMLRVDFESEPTQVEPWLTPDRFQQLVGKHDAVVFSDYGKGSLAHVQKMIKAAHKAKKLVFVDPKGSDWKRYCGADVITPNRAELQQVIGKWATESDLHEKVQELCEDLSIGALLLTKSEEGMTLFEGNQVTSVPADTREVADVTGAGDTVIATLALMSISGLNLSQAMVWSNRAAGLAVGKFGTASISHDELRR